MAIFRKGQVLIDCGLIALVPPLEEVVARIHRYMQEAPCEEIVGLDYELEL